MGIPWYVIFSKQSGYYTSCFRASISLLLLFLFLFFFFLFFFCFVFFVFFFLSHDIESICTGGILSVHLHHEVVIQRWISFFPQWYVVFSLSVWCTCMFQFSTAVPSTSRHCPYPSPDASTCVLYCFCSLNSTLYSQMSNVIWTFHSVRMKICLIWSRAGVKCMCCGLRNPPVLHYSANYIFWSFGMMNSFWVVSNIQYCFRICERVWTALRL